MYYDINIIKDLARNNLIAIDTSALMFIEECNIDVSKLIMDSLLFAEERVWLPNHVAEVELKEHLEFKGKKSGALGKIQKFNKRLSSSIDRIEAEITNTVEGFKDEGHALLASVLSEVDIKKILIEHLYNYNIEKDKQTIESKNFLKAGLANTFQKMLSSKTDKVLTDEEFNLIKRSHVHRFENKIPPGYCDFGKKDNSYGDFIIWMELMKKSKIINEPILFITRDKKEDWFELNQGEIVGPRKELIQEAKDYGADIHIIYLNDYVKVCRSLITSDYNELLDMMDNEDQVYIELENYIIENMYDEIQEVLTEVGRFEYNSDYLEMDVIEHIDILDTQKNIEDGYVNVECSVRFEAAVVHNYHYDSREPNMELTGNMTVDAELSMQVEILYGYHNEESKYLSFEEIELKLDSYNVIESTDPLGDEDEDDYDPTDDF